MSWSPGNKGGQKSLLSFKHHFFQDQVQYISKSKKKGKDGRRPAWLRKELMENSNGGRKSTECGKVI